MSQDLEYVLEAIDNGRNILVHGCGGVGKSYLIKKVASKMTKRGKKIYLTALTGVAAMELSVPKKKISASTLHSWSGIGLGEDPPNKIIAKINHEKRLINRWLSVDLLIIDEISMMGLRLFEKLEYIARQVRRNNRPFGGITLLLSGDFLQLAPVKDRWVFQSERWEKLDLLPIIMETPYRFTDREWANLLLRVRRGEQTEDDIRFLRSRMTAYRKWLRDVDEDDVSIVKPTTLFPKRNNVDSYNNAELDKLRTKTVRYEAIDIFKPYNEHARMDYYLKPIDETIPRHITLKIGAQVMLKANLDIEAGLANGSRGVVIDLDNISARVKWKNDTETQVGFHLWIQEDKDGFMSRSMIPLILAYSMTIHKSQGCSLDDMIADVGPNIFAPGQAYVELSRVRDSKGLLISEFYDKSIKCDADALEYVRSLEGKD